MDISVVIPTYNRRRIVQRNLEKLFAQDYPPARFEIIVVDDGSSDGTAEALRQLPSPCRLRVLQQPNRGPSAARNAGYRAAESGLVLFLDDDMLCEPGLLAAHVAAHQGPGCKVAFGAIFLSPDSPRTLAAECFHREIGAFYLEQRRNPALQWQITDSVFLNTSLPRALLEQVGGFDESFRMREDLELGLRLFALDVQPVYLSNAVAWQYYDKTAADLVRDARRFAVGDVSLARKHPDALIVGQLNWLARQPRRRQQVHAIAARVPFLADLALTPLCWLGAIFFHQQALRNLGVRALQLRRRAHWYRRVLHLGWRPSEARSRPQA